MKTEKEFEELLKKYENYIKKTAYNQSNDDFMRKELIQQAKINLWLAYQRYDESKGDFHNYAQSYIRGGILSYINYYSTAYRTPVKQMSENKVERKVKVDFDFDIEEKQEDKEIDDVQYLQLKAIDRVVSKFSDEEQSLYQLYFKNNLAINQISDKMQIPSIVVNQKMSNIRAKIKRGIKKIKGV